MTDKVLSSSNLRLLLLYACQGFPYGFQSRILPILFREWNISYRNISLSNLAYLPWAARPFVAAFIEDLGEHVFLNVLLIYATLQFVIAVMVLCRFPTSLQITLLTSNAVAMMYDIWVDKWAIKLRRSSQGSDMDLANVIQVVGYKLGAMLSGSVLLYISVHLLSQNIPLYYGLVLSPIVGGVLTFVLYFFVRRDLDPIGAKIGNDKETNKTVMSRDNISRIIFKHITKNLLFYALILTYKSGESIGDNMFISFLKHDGMNVKIISGISAWNDLIGILGSLVMSQSSVLIRHKDKILADKEILMKALALNVLPQIMRCLVVVNASFRTVPAVIAVTSIEHFIGGALTVALFNYMFSSTITSIEGTHYSVLACIEVLGKLIFGSLAGTLVDAKGFSWTFAFAVVLSLVPVIALSITVSNNKNKEHSS